MQIIDDLTQADTVEINVNEQVKAIYEKLQLNKAIVVCAPKYWGKSTVIEGVLTKWEKEYNSSIPANDRVCRFDEVLFLSDAIDKWSELLQNLLAHSATDVQSSLKNKFPKILDTNREGVSVGVNTSIADLLSCTTKIFKKLAIEEPIFFSGIHNLTHLKHDWPAISSAINELTQIKNGPKIILGSEYEYIMQKNVLTDDELKKLQWHPIDLPTEKKWTKALAKFLKKKSMKMQNEVLTHLVDRLQQHPVYIKEAINKLVVASKNKAKERDVDQVIDQMLQEYTPILSIYERTLSSVQRSYLTAIARNEPMIYAKDQLENYQLGTSANVAKMKRTFLEREILINREERLRFTDPMLSLFFANKP